MRRTAVALVATILAIALAAVSSVRAQAQDDIRRLPLPVVQGSLFTSRIELGETRPELRSLRHIQLVHVGALGAARTVLRTREEALALGATLRQALLDGADFDALARTYSSTSNAAIGSVMGTFQPGVLQSEFDSFLFAADIGEVSAVIAAPTGVHILQRVERQAACLEIRIDGDSAGARREIDEIFEHLRGGADFAELATTRSQNPDSARRGGALAAFERGPTDRLLKSAAFNLAVGEVSRPLQTPLGWHIIKRVPVEGFPAELVEDNWMRFRGFAILHAENPLGVPAPDRSSDEAAALARSIEARLRAGEDFAELAREFNDDMVDGRGRAGELGWIHRRQPGIPTFMSEAFRLEVGTWLGPHATNIGWVFVLREA